MVLVTHRKQGVFREGDSLSLSLGTTLPTGKTEEDPFELGDSGLKHLHIQFGTGTFDPLLELNYSMPVAGKLGLGAYALGRFPAYENSKTYQGPMEITSGVLCVFRTKPAGDSGANRPPNPAGNRPLETGFPEGWPISRKGGRFPGKAAGFPESVSRADGSDVGLLRYHDSFSEERSCRTKGSPCAKSKMSYA